MVIQPLSTRLIKPNFCFHLSHRRSTTVSLETRNSFISNTVKISGPNRSVEVTDHFTCISTNVIYCITCTLCKKIYIGETGRRLADRFREHLRDVEKNNTDASKPVARYFNLPNHSHHNMAICGLSLHHGNTESRKNLEQKLIFQLGTLSPHGINERLEKFIFQLDTLSPHGINERLSFN